MLEVICSKNKKVKTSLDCYECFKITKYTHLRPACVKQFLTVVKNSDISPVTQLEEVPNGCNEIKPRKRKKRKI